MDFTLLRRLNQDLSPSKTTFTLAHQQSPPYYTETEKEHSPTNVPRHRRTEFLRKTGTFGQSEDPEDSKLDLNEEESLQRHVQQENSRGFSDDAKLANEEEYSGVRSFIGQMNGNPRIKFDLRRKNLHVAEFRERIREIEEAQKSGSEKEGPQVASQIGKRLLMHKNSINKLFNERGTLSISRLTVERTEPVCYSPETEKKEPTYTELKRLLEITEEELFEANQRIQTLEKAEMTSVVGNVEQHMKILEKSVDINLDSVFEYMKVVKSVVESNIVHIENIIEKTREPADLIKTTTEGSSESLDNSGKGKEMSVRCSFGDVEELRKLLKENVVCIEEMSKVNVEAIKNPVLKVFERKFELPKENKEEDGGRIKAEEMRTEIERIEKMSKDKIEMYKEELELREQKINRLYQRVNELEGLLAGNERLTSTARKLIELEKKMEKSYEEKEELQKLIRSLKTENEEHKSSLERMKQQYESMQKQLSEGRDGSQGKQKFDESSVMDYIQKLEEELLESQVRIKKIETEIEVSATLNIQKDNLIGSLKKINQDLRRENQIFEQKVQSLEQQQQQQYVKVQNKSVDDSGQEKMFQPIEDSNTKEQIQAALTGTHESKERLATFSDQHSYNENKDAQKTEAIEQLCLMILSKDKEISLSDDSKRVLQEVFGEGFPKLIDKYERRIAVLKSNQDKLQQALHSEIQNYTLTIKDLQMCSEPLFELLSILEHIKFHDTGKSQLAKFSQRLQQRKQELLNAVKEGQESYERLKELYNSLIDHIDGEESDVASKALYSPLNKRLKAEETEESVDENTYKEENSFLKREIDYMSQQMESLKIQNNSLNQQLEEMRARVEETQNSYSKTLNSMRETARKKPLTFKSPMKTEQKKKNNERGKENFTSSYGTTGRSQTRGMGSKEGTLDFRRDDLYVEDMRAMVLLQANLIEHCNGEKGYTLLIVKKNSC